MPDDPFGFAGSSYDDTAWAPASTMGPGVPSDPFEGAGLPGIASDGMPVLAAGFGSLIEGVPGGSGGGVYDGFMAEDWVFDSPQFSDDPVGGGFGGDTTYQLVDIDVPQLTLPDLNFTLSDPNLPSLHDLPSGVSMADLDHMAANAGDTTVTLQNITDSEWSTVFYRMPDGTLGQTAAHTAGSVIEVDIKPDLQEVPTGATVIGWQHSHPLNMTDQREPSSTDTSITQALENAGTLIKNDGGLVYVDQNLITFVTGANADSNQSDIATYAYDNYHLSNPSPGGKVR